ncbi:MAG: STAS/SEC14 domain-containing protein [Parasphingorhabdus sp.]
MMRVIPNENGTKLVALSYASNITAEDIDQTYAALNVALEGNTKLSLFIEMLSGFDIEGPAIFQDFRRSPEFFKHLKQFERIAIVTNQDWLRGIARLEVALLAVTDNDFELHVYDESERDYALAWAKGEVEQSHIPAITELPSDDPNVAAFEVNGKIRKEDIGFSKKLMVSFLNDEPPRRLLVRIKDLQGIQPSTLFDRQMIAMKQEARRHLDRYAVVGGPVWVQHLIRSLAPLFSFEIKTFDLDDEDEAWDWVKETVPA